MVDTDTGIPVYKKEMVYLLVVFFSTFYFLRIMYHLLEGVLICNCVHVIVCLCHVRVTVHECL